MERAKSIDELYDEVKDYDLVITNDAALASALNARIDRPIVGFFAMTPKQIAEIEAVNILNKPIERDLRLINEICKDTDLDFKYVHGELENIKFIRSFTKEVDKYLHTRDAHKVYDSFCRLPTQIRVMTEFRPEESEFISGKEKVAVIAPDLFNDLDKSFNDGRFDTIEPFTGEDYAIDTIYEIGNDRQLAENAVSLIDRNNASDYAIVLNTASPITDAVRSSLYRHGIPFINSLNVRDLSQVRDYLQFLDLAMGYWTLRVKHIREVFSNYNGKISSRSDEFLLCKQADSMMSPRAIELRDLMRDVGKHTYNEAIGILRNPGEPQVRMLLSDMGCGDDLISPDGVNQLIYAVNNVNDLHHNQEIPENEKNGVLVTDCNNSVYIDRSVVIYLGMEQDWNMTIPSKPYIDIMDETEHNAMRLKILLQQGSRRFYCVNTTKRGEPARPSTMFDVIYNDDMDTFSKICGNIVRGRWSEEKAVVFPQKGETSLDSERPIDTPFSKSTFNCYYQCPRAYMFKALIPSLDKKQTEFGNLIHEFAELYFCYRGLVRELGVDHFVNSISDKYSGLSSPLMEGIDRDRIRLAMCNIMSYIDRFAISDPPLDVDNSSRQYPNAFMELLELTKTSSLCETEQYAPGCPMHGDFDLYCSNTISDYKTGKSKEIKDISKAMSFSPKNTLPEFQPLMYLSIAKLKGNDRASFNQFYVLGNDVESLDPGFDISQNVRNIRIEEGSVLDCLFNSIELRESLSETLSKDYRSKVDCIMDALRSHTDVEPQAWSSDEEICNDVLRSCGMNINATNSKSVRSAIDKVVKRIDGMFVDAGDVLVVPSDSIDVFTERLQEMHDMAIEQSLTEFPATPRSSCEKCEFYQICTKDVIVLEEDAENGSE